MTPGHQQAAPLTEFAPITVNIEYTLCRPADGVQFILPTETYPHVSSCNWGHSHFTHSIVF